MTIMTQLSKSVLLSGLMCLLFPGCHSFLDEYSQDERVPATVKDYEEILYGEAYFKNEHLPYEYVELLSDDVTAMYNAANINGDDTRQEVYGYYTWQDNPEVTPQGGLRNDVAWEKLYHQILTANVVLEKVAGIEGKTEDKARLEGEAHAIRAFAYFLLVNLYADPYTTPAEASKTPGVPINTHTYGEDTNFPRATLAEVYDVIISDLEAGMQAFAKDDAPKNIFRWNEAALATLGSRIFLYMRNWDKAKEYADIALSKNAYLRDLNAKNAEDPQYTKPFITKDNREINYSFGFYLPKPLSSGHLYYFKPSDELLALYSEGDLRYFNNVGNFITAKKVRVGGGFWNPIYAYFTSINKNGLTDDALVYGYAIRSAEAYLNRAEALAMKGDRAGALADLATLRAARLTKEAAALSDPASDEEMIRMVRDERRRELCFEMQRWFDLRRWGKPGLTHEYITDGEANTREVFTLPANSPKYTLPVPQAVLNSDAALGKN